MIITRRNEIPIIAIGIYYIPDKAYTYNQRARNQHARNGKGLAQNLIQIRETYESFETCNFAKSTHGLFKGRSEK